MSVILSCGHEDSEIPHGIPLVQRTYNEFGRRAVQYSDVCKGCYIKHLEDYIEDMIFHKWEEEEWLHEVP